MGALIQLAVLCLIVCFVYISKKDKSSKTADKLSIKEKYLLLAVGAVILIGLFTFALSNGLKPNDLTLLLVIFIVIAFIFFVIKFIFQKLTSIQQNSSSSIMEKKDEIEKLFQLKEKGIITEEEFNLKREEFLNDTADVSETSSSGFSLWGILVVLSGLLTFCSIISGGNSDKGSGICGKYNTFYGGAFSGGWITTFDGFTIYIEFPNEYINKEWSKYDKQNICISGNTVRTPQQGNQPDVYTIYNPRFNGYAN